MLWAGESSDVDLASARALKERKNSHDAISHSLLALFETETGLLDTAKLLFVVFLVIAVVFVVLAVIGVGAARKALK